MTNHLLPPLRPLVLKRDQPYVQLSLNSEQTLSLQQNCHPVDIQRLSPIEQHKVPTHTSVTTQQQPPCSRQEQSITTAHLPHQLQQFITAHKSALHSRTPINTHHLYQALISHPDQVFVTQLIHNLEHGCAIGYSGPQFSHCCNNLSSAFQQPSVLDNMLASECSAGRILGPFQSPPLPNLHCSGLGMIPKHDGGWRTIYHLSAPHGSSINDYIDPEQYSLSYCSVDDAFAIVNTLGKGALMAKIDLKMHSASSQ